MTGPANDNADKLCRDVDVAVWAGREYAEICEEAGFRVWLEGCEDPDALPPYQEKPLVSVLLFSVVTEEVTIRWKQMIERFPHLGIVFCYSTIGDDPDKVLNDICLQVSGRTVPAFETYFIDDMEPGGQSLVAAVKRVLGRPGSQPKVIRAETSIPSDVMPVTKRPGKTNPSPRPEGREVPTEPNDIDIVKLLERISRKKHIEDYPQVPGYEVLRLISRHGFAETFLARRQQDSQCVYLKVMPLKGLHKDRTYSRIMVLERELISKLQPPHPNVIEYIDSGKQDDFLWLATERVTGPTLDAYQKSSGTTLPLDEVVALVPPLLDGLEYLHDKGFVHRDIKPGNVFIDGTPPSFRTVITGLDMGTFYKGGRSPELRERPGTCSGTPPYMAREQVLDFPNVKPGVDLFAAAATVYTLLTGKFVREHTAEQDPWRIVLSNPVIPIRDRDSGIPPVIATVIDKALSMEPNDRYRNALQMREAFVSAARLCGFIPEDPMKTSADSTARAKVSESMKSKPGDTQLAVADVPTCTDTKTALPTMGDCQEWCVGDIIADRYEVKAVAGEGGFGRVYRVYDRVRGRDVAAKLPRLEFSRTQSSMQRFIHRYCLWESLDRHPHVIDFYDVEIHSGVPPAFVEYADAGSLRNWIDDGRMYEGGRSGSLERILDFSIQVGWALEFLHSNRIVHQDVKPSNFLLTSEGLVKSGGFSLAQRAQETYRANEGPVPDLLVDVEGMTPAYCSPEQAEYMARRGARVSLNNLAKLTQRTDIYSFAILVFEMFCGGSCWAGGQFVGDVFESYLEDGPPEPNLPTMPLEVAPLLKWCFAMDPRARPTTMHEVIETLKSIYFREMGSPYPRPAP